MGLKKYGINLVSLDSKNPDTNYYNVPIASIEPNKKAIFRLPLSYPTWMGGGNLLHTHLSMYVRSGSGTINFYSISGTEDVDWLEAEATWNSSQTTISTSWLSPGVTTGPLIESKAVSGNYIDFNDLQIKTDIENAISPPASATEVKMGYILETFDRIDIDTVKSHNRPVLILTLAGPAIASVTPLADNSGSAFSIYVVVDPGTEDITGFDFVSDYNGATIVSSATNFKLEQELSDGYIVYRVDMPVIANGNYYLSVKTANYQYVYERTFTVGTSDLINISGTSGNSFTIGNSTIIDDVAASISMSQLVNAINHAGNIGDPHSIHIDSGLADAIISGINSNATLQINIDRLRSDLLTTSEHAALSVTNHSDWVAAISGFGVSSLGAFGDATTLTGDVKIEAGDGVNVARDAVNNSLVISASSLISSGSDNVVARYDGANNIQSSTMIIDDNGNAMINGDLAVKKNPSENTNIYIDSGDSSNDKQSILRFSHNGDTRWSFRKHTDNDFYLGRHSAAGIWVDNPISISQSTGNINFNNSLLVSGNSIGYNASGGLSFDSSNNASLTGTLTMGGNIILNNRYISNDGGNEGISISDAGTVYMSENAVVQGTTWLGYNQSNNAYISVTTASSGSALNFLDNTDTNRWTLTDSAGTFCLRDAGVDVFTMAAGGHATFNRRVDIVESRLNVGRSYTTGKTAIGIESGNGSVYHNSILLFRHGTTNCWNISKDNNAAGDIHIGRYNNSGVFVDNPLSISRATGVIKFNGAYNFPTTVGSSGQTLVLDGSGNLTWGVPGGGTMDKWTNVLTGSTSSSILVALSTINGSGRALITQNGFKGGTGANGAIKLAIKIDGGSTLHLVNMAVYGDQSGHTSASRSITVDFSTQLRVYHAGEAASSDTSVLYHL